jgi:hypothetical protein
VAGLLIDYLLGNPSNEQRINGPFSKRPILIHDDLNTTMF